MSDLTSNDVLRPGPGPVKAWLVRHLMAGVPLGFALLRRVWPIPHLGKFYVVTLHDDVREVFGTDADFGVVYNDNLQVITGHKPFILGMGDTPAYHAQIAQMRQVISTDDLTMLGDKAEALAAALVAASNGELDVVAFVRRVTFDLFSWYFGVPEPAHGHLDVWATRLFEFQFAGSPSDTRLRAAVDAIAPVFRAHIDAEIARRKAAGDDADDVLGRCLKRQAAGEPGYTDVEIRTVLFCMMVGGAPQPPTVVPQAMEQLLRRPDALADAQAAARADDDARLRDIVLEALRFDPLAPGLPRRALRDGVVARGTKRETRIPEGATVFVAFASAMMDGQRVPEPSRFNPNRLPHDYIHFGYGLHECFGRHINRAILHRILKPLLQRHGLRRADGAAGRLSKRGIFADSLGVRYSADQPPSSICRPTTAMARS